MDFSNFVIFRQSSFALSLFIALLLDLLLADPQELPHPVVWVGKMIAFFDRRFNRPLLEPRQALARGALLAVLLPCLLSLALQALLSWLFSLSPYLYFVFRTLLMWQLLALQGLAREAQAVARALREDGLFAARRQVGRIVGRNTANLSAPEVINATVETVAENFADGVIAPLFFLLLFDLPGMFFYKVVNTLDSMIAYHNVRYEYFGKTAAKLDDLLNFIPARLAALFLLLASALYGADFKAAWRIFKRDRYKHLSPNSAQTEAVMAGALGLRLGGPHEYHGKIVEKDYIGDAKKQPEIFHIDKAVGLLYLASFLAVLLVFFIQQVIF